MSNAIAIAVSSETASKLFLAYVGLSPVRRDAVDAVVKESKGAISRSQATFNEICEARIDLYAKRGEEAQGEIMKQALTVLQARGMSAEDAQKALRIGL